MDVVRAGYTCTIETLLTQRLAHRARNPTHPAEMVTPPSPMTPSLPLGRSRVSGSVCFCPIPWTIEMSRIFVATVITVRLVRGALAIYGCWHYDSGRLFRVSVPGALQVDFEFLCPCIGRNVNLSRGLEGFVSHILRRIKYSLPVPYPWLP